MSLHKVGDVNRSLHTDSAKTNSGRKTNANGMHQFQAAKLRMLDEGATRGTLARESNTSTMDTHKETDCNSSPLRCKELRGANTAPNSTHIEA